MNTSNTAFTQFNIQVSHDLTCNVMPLLHQIKHALANLIDNNASEIIDLRSIPLAPGEEEKILEILGQGEISAELNALGPSEILETEYTGVWLITHFNDDNEIISRHIEITYMPEILLSPKEDVSSAFDRLVSTLNEEPTYEKPAGNSE